MSFSAAELSDLESMLAPSDGGAQLAADFRRRYPGRSLTRCNISDMGTEAAYRQFAAFDLYLVDGREHCWHITDDPVTATGIVVARRA